MHAAFLIALVCGGAAEDHFENRVRPLLAKHCQDCHGAKKQESGLRLDGRAAALTGGEQGPAIVAGSAAKSLLMAAVRHAGDLKMPPRGKLSPQEVADLAQWLDAGAPWPGSVAVASSTRSGEPTAAELQHWAYQPVRAPQPPPSADADWNAHDIDRFLHAEHARHGVVPIGLADRRTLLRRATFDLHGLPPTPEELAGFLADDRPDAFARVVDRLLASPRYGERWGRHWLDVARYADTAGDGADYPIREARLYRDYVIDALNTDLPYDQFLKEQIAGDLLAAEGPPEHYARRVTATGFVAIGKRYGYAPKPDFQHLDFADAIDSMSRATMGLSLGCCRCHDHKYDAFTAADYYALYGIFQSSKWSFPGGEEHKRPEHLLPLVPPSEAARLLAEQKAKITALDKEIAAAELDPERHAELDGLRQRRKDERKAAEHTPPYEIAYGVSDGTPLDAKLQKRGEPDKLGVTVPRRFPVALGGFEVPANTGSGRKQLAEWIARPQNPLTARVFVNRVWQWRFGRGLVATPSDFGVRGERPSHPALLDHLAATFVKDGWSLKALHRRTMLARAYRLAATDHAENQRRDPENRWLWRWTRRPLDAESLRDSVLALGGGLDLARPGPHPFPPVDTWGYTIHKPFHAVYEARHRTLYLMSQRNRRHPYLALFDAADPNASAEERRPTVAPTQTLFLMNSPLPHEQSRGFADRALAVKDPAARVRWMMESAHGTPPTARQTAQALTFVHSYAAALPASPTRERDAWAAYARVLLSANAFLFVE